MRTVHKPGLLEEEEGNAVRMGPGKRKCVGSVTQISYYKT